MSENERSDGAQRIESTTGADIYTESAANAAGITTGAETDADDSAAALQANTGADVTSANIEAAADALSQVDVDDDAAEDSAEADKSGDADDGEEADGDAGAEDGAETEDRVNADDDASADDGASPADSTQSSSEVAQPQAPEAPQADKPDEPASKPDEPASEPDEPSPDDGDEAPEYDFGEAKTHLLALQQRIRELKIPVVIALEGWAAAGKGAMVGELLEGLDPRGYNVHVRESESRDEDMYPPLRRYWVDMPKAGNIEIFIGSWYHSACADAVEGKRGARRLSARMERFNLMERMLARDGALILKFFINISKKEQKRRLKALESDKLTRSRVTKADRAQSERYEDWRDAYNQMLAATNEPEAEWRVLSGKSRRECKRQLYAAVTEAFENALKAYESGARAWDSPLLGEHEPVRTEHIPPLCDYETMQTMDEPYKQAVDEAQRKLRALQYELHRRRIPMVLAFEGWDAAGKGGAIRRLSSALDPRGFTVVPISAPTPEEKAHHHLWRFWRTLPKAGQITIFDRTWYGRVMVERIEGFCTENQWKRAYEEINLFERDLTENGAIVLKFWLQISKDEQLRRFVDRRDTPEKQWKITDEDWRNRDKWQQYEVAVDEMLKKTNTREAPWIVVEGDNKHYARLKVLNTVINAVEARLKRD